MRTAVAALCVTISHVLVSGAARARPPCEYVGREDIDRCMGDVLVTTASKDDVVFLDDEKVGSGPMLIHWLLPGEHVVRVSAVGAPPRRYTFTVRPGQPAVVGAPGTALTRASAPPLSEASRGFFDRCGGYYEPIGAYAVSPVNVGRLIELRRTRGLTPHLPFAAVGLAGAESARPVQATSHSAQ